DPTLRVDEIAIPHEIADVLMYPERATDYNIEKLQNLVWNDGAQSVRRGEKKFNLQYALKGDKKYNFKLQIGDVVERKMQDGDITILNRQPSLHKGSLVAMKIIRREGKTIRMNLA